MNSFKKLFTSFSGYWLHKVSTLPVGTNLYIDIHKRIGYGPLKVIFDVGANTGQSWKEFRRNEPSSLIYCFEPVSGSFKQLARFTREDSKCIKEQLALAQSAGERTISLFDETSALNSLKEGLMNKSGDARKEVIQVTTLDSYCEKHNISNIDLLKIDTEGFELEVLEGSNAKLKAGEISFIYAEVGFNRNDVRHTPFHKLNDRLQDFGYLFFGMYQLAGHSWKEGGYYGNALFVHESVYNP